MHIVLHLLVHLSYACYNILLKILIIAKMFLSRFPYTRRTPTITIYSNFSWTWYAIHSKFNFFFSSKNNCILFINGFTFNILGTIYQDYLYLIFTYCNFLCIIYYLYKIINKLFNITESSFDEEADMYNNRNYQIKTITLMLYTYTSLFNLWHLTKQKSN